MTIAAFSQMKRLQEGLAIDPLGIEAELTTFPSGSAMLDVRHAGRAFVMAYTPLRSFCVDELRRDEGFTNGYQFVFEEFEPAAKQLRALAFAASPAGVPQASLSLVVLQSGDVEAARDFYGLLGLTFVEEKHGTGPLHYSATLGPLVLEIYPCKESKSIGSVRLGFRVPELDNTLEGLRRRGARIIREATASPWGRRAIVEDPDGNRVELMPSDSAPFPLERS